MPKTYTAPLIQDFDSTGLCSGTYEAVYSGTTGATTVAWTSIGGTIVGSTTDDIVTVEDYRSIPGVGEVRRTGNVVATHNCPYTQFYKIERKYTTKVSITGGLGGEGGNGCSYNENTMYEADWRNGDEGEPAEGGSNNEKNMNGGNYGGTGGTGGWWGNNGYGGGRGYGNGDYGTLGKGHGVGIVGVGFLNIDSTIGEIDGGYTGVIVYPPIDPSKILLSSCTATHLE